MKIHDVTITVSDIGAATSFFRGVMELTTTTARSSTAVDIGAGRLILNSGAPDPGAHHLAFEVDTAHFPDVASWLRSRVDTLAVDGSDVISGPPGWKSSSLYVMGPDGMVLEAITRHDTPPHNGGDRFIGISEIGLGVTNVAAARRTAEHALGVTPYHLSSPAFEPLGDHNGLLIVVDRDRIWFPTKGSRPSRGHIKATLVDADGSKTTLTVAAGVLTLGPT